MTSKIHRLLRLITLLQRGQKKTTETLMRELGVSRRTLFRDLRSLEEAGIPYRFDRKHGYRIEKEFQLPQANLSVHEALGMMLLGKYAANQRDRPLMSSALSAIYRLIATLPESVRHACSDLMRNVEVSPDSQTPGDLERDHYLLLHRCIAERKTCRIVYHEADDAEDIHAHLNPYLLHMVRNIWYVMGYSDVHDEVRMFKLSRFMEIEPTDERFERPEGFKASDKLGSAWRMIPEGREYDIALEFSKKVSQDVREIIWHPSQQAEPLADGRCLLRFRVDGIGEIAWWVCGYADQVKVLKPPELRDRVEQMLRSALKRYEAEAPVVVATTGLNSKTTQRNK